jgi:hypothetical protein
VRNTGEIFEFIDDIKEVSDNINPFTSIYSDTGTGDIEFPEEYEMPAERAGREAVTGMKNSARPQSPNKRRKLTRL